MEQSKTKFVLYSGLRTIGGVNASVTYGKDRVIFEFGAAYDPKADIYDGVVEKRNANWVRDKMRLGILPRIEGVFRREDLGDDDLISAEESEYNTAIFISHLHLDHMAFIGTVAPEIPVYMHKNAQLIEQALEETGQGVDTLLRTYRDLIPDTPVRIGEIEVLPILTNDESYRDFAFLITTPDGTVHWTGDFSLHGRNADLNLRQMEILKKREIDVLLCDCTSFMDDVMKLMYNTTDAKAIKPDPAIPEGMLSEEEYDDSTFDIIKSRSGLCVFNYYQREMTEAQRFIEWSAKLGRVCVFEPDAAYIVYRFLECKPYVYIPDVKRYSSEAGKTPEWFQTLLNNCQIVTAEEISANPSGYMLQNSYAHILELFNFSAKDSVYIHVDGIPIGEFDPAYANMRGLVEMAGFEYVSFFCKNYFGHGYPCQVKYFVDEVNPKVLIPCHSFNPERLLPKDGVQLLPELYKTYILRDHRLTPED